MLAQHLLALGGLILAGNLAIAAKLEQDDVPNRCWNACGSVVGVSRRCDNQHDNDSAELQCVCNWEAAKTQVPLCAACITQYGPHDNDRDDDDDDDDDNEALDLVHSCKFSTTTYNAAAATTLSASVTGTTDPAATGATATATGGTTSVSDSASTSSQGSTGTTSSAAAATSTGAAVGLTAPGVLSLIAVAGLMPLACL